MNEKKIARICWNTKGWIKPSGSVGKSKHSGTHEYDFGFGAEEWLFDFNKAIDGYTYGFLEPIKQGNYVGSTFDIYLYTIDGISKNRFLIGHINNVQVLDVKEKQKIGQLYSKRKWDIAMINDLKNIDKQQNINIEEYINVKYKEEDVHLNTEPLLIDPENELVKSSRYKLLSERYIPTKFKEGVGKKFTFVPSSSKNTLPWKRAYSKVSTIIELENRHQQICKELYKTMKKLYGQENIACEIDLGNGCRADMMLKQGKMFTLIEIKTYTSLRHSVREAVGQLLEYAYWIDDKAVHELIIVSFQEPDQEVLAYLERLRAKASVNIRYWQFANNKLTQY